MIIGFDLDNTLIDASDVDWATVDVDKQAFNNLSLLRPYSNILALLKRIEGLGYDIVIITGRDTSKSKPTLKCLKESGLSKYPIHMRKAPTSSDKPEVFYSNETIGTYKAFKCKELGVSAFFDDNVEQLGFIHKIAKIPTFIAKKGRFSRKK